MCPEDEQSFMGLERHGGKWLMTKFSFWGGVNPLIKRTVLYDNMTSVSLFTFFYDLINLYDDFFRGTKGDINFFPFFHESDWSCQAPKVGKKVWTTEKYFFFKINKWINNQYKMV